MANIQSAKKRSRQADSRNSLKSSQRASMRTMIKNVEDAIAENDVAKAKDLFISTQKAIDKLANKKVLPKNAVARQKSRLSKSIKKLG
ncbi:MAG: 30S ribosomal protein S20 [Gammaproteobacteria bacterium]|nr:30S ribosomal protein S20 [Gammaproteobacteria bacterium]